MIIIYPGFEIILEISLVALFIALIGAIGFVLFGSSLSNDWADKRRNDLIKNNPWTYVSGKDSVEVPSGKEIRWPRSGLVYVIIVLSVLILLLLAIRFGWFGISSEYIG